MTIFHNSSIDSFRTGFEAGMERYSSLLSKPDYSIAETVLCHAKAFDLVENRPTYILDLYKGEFLFVSTKYLNLMGIEAHQEIDFELFFKAQHPGDIPINLKVPQTFVDLLFEANPIEKPYIKLISDFRLSMATGGWVRVHEQLIMLHPDPQGNPWLILAICDISPDQNIERESGALIINSKSNDVLFTMGNYELLFPQRILTKREYEVLKLIAKGYSSKQIANYLFVSTNTVNNHRRNLIAKTGCSNTFEAIKYLGN